MKQLETRREFKIAFQAFVLVMLMTFASCSTDQIDLQVEQNTPERIDLVFSGEIETTINTESDDLVTFSPNTQAIINEGEQSLILDLGNAKLKLTVFNQFESNPLRYDIPYPAYTIDLINGRATYVIGEYIVNDIVEYSTVSELKKDMLQTNILNIENNDSYYTIFVDALSLYTSKKDGGPIVASEIIVSGTFTLDK